LFTRNHKKQKWPFCLKFKFQNLQMEPDSQTVFIQNLNTKI
jgi:hypothetical protein